MRDTGWFKSTRSGGASDACVEVRITDAATHVRDSKNPGVSMTVDLAALVAAVKVGPVLKLPGLTAPAHQHKSTGSSPQIRR